MFPKLTNRLILAPMEDVTSLGFRLLCRYNGASMAYTEQTSALALTRESEKSLQRIKTNIEDKPIGLQLFGRNPEVLIEAGKRYEKNFDIIDLNLGCPSKKIVSQGYGSALLKEKDKVFEIVNSLTKNLNKPVTVKIRSGFKRIEALKLVKVIENAGASAITIHARTQMQGYSGKADWNLIKKVKNLVSIPIIGNGDVVDGKSAEEMLKICDYCMIGRAARDNPMIFKMILEYFKEGKNKMYSEKDRREVFSRYLMLEDNFKLLKLRASDWTKGMNKGKLLRVEIQKCKDKESLKRLFLGH